MGFALLKESLGLPRRACSGFQEAKATAGPPLSVERVTEFSTFLALQPLWNRLCDDAGIDHPFLRHEWIRTWWECFGAGKELFVLLVKSGQEIIAIAPLMLGRARMYGLKVRRLEFISNVHTPRFDFIVARQQDDAYGAIWTYLVSCSGLWDVLSLSQLPAGSRTLEELPRLAAGGGFLSGLWLSGDSPYLPLHGTWDAYVKGLDQKHRSNLRNRLKRLSRRGEVGVETIATIEHVASALTDGLLLEAAAWKGAAGTAICCRPEVQQFYTKLAERAAERGWLRLHFLTLDHHRIAFQYSMFCRDKLYLLKPGYDPAYAPYSPSNLLCYLVLRDAFDHSLAEHDFLGTAESWKLEWTLATRPHSCLFVFPRLLRLRLLHYIKFRLIPSVRQSRFYPRLRDILVELKARAEVRRHKLKVPAPA